MFKTIVSLCRGVFFRSLISFFLGFLSFTLYGQTESAKSIQLSLEEAILLAIRENPSVQESQLSHIEQKFALELAHWNFQPQYQIVASRTVTRTISGGGPEQVSNSSTLNPQMTLNSPIGTQFTLTSANNVTGHYNPALTLQIVQPLMRGFGRPIVEAALYDAMDSEKSKRLEIEGTLRNTVSAVIKAYLAVMSARKAIQIDEEALLRTQKAVEQTRLFIKAGHKAGNELVTVKADVAKSQANLENSNNNLKQAEYALLTAIGLDPNTPLQCTNLNIDALIKKYAFSSLDEVQRLTLENDISYQTAQITLEGTTKRALLKAKDDTRWQLNLTVNGTTGGGSGGGFNAGTPSLANGDNQSQQAALNLIIPIDDRKSQVALANAKIALREAEMNLKTKKWELQTKAINQRNTMMSAERELHFSEDAEQLQEKTYAITNQKYMYGLSDSLELQTAQQNLVSSQVAVVKSRINYLNALIDLDAMVGKTLKTWNVKVRYGEWINDHLVVE